METPEATAAPLVLALGVALLAAGIVVGVAMTIVGGLLLFVGLGLWVVNLLPGRGHFHESFVEASERAARDAARSGTVERPDDGHAGLPRSIAAKGASDFCGRQRGPVRRIGDSASRAASTAY